MKRFLAILALSAICCTAFSMLVKLEYCMDGDGRGFPFAITHPAHGPSKFEFLYKGQAIEGMTFDTLSLGLNLLSWSILIGLPLAILDRRKKLHKFNPSRAAPDTRQQNVEKSRESTTSQ
jgi:hypothetical protein